MDCSVVMNRAMEEKFRRNVEKREMRKGVGMEKVECQFVSQSLRAENASSVALVWRLVRQYSVWDVTATLFV